MYLPIIQLPNTHVNILQYCIVVKLFDIDIASPLYTIYNMYVHECMSSPHIMQSWVVPKWFQVETIIMLTLCDVDGCLLMIV